MKTPLLLSALVAPILAGCVHPLSYHQAGRTQEQTLEDYRQCDYQAQIAVASQSNPLIAADVREQLVRECMRQKGYTR